MSNAVFIASGIATVVGATAASFALSGEAPAYIIAGAASIAAGAQALVTFLARPRSGG